MKKRRKGKRLQKAKQKQGLNASVSGSHESSGEPAANPRSEAVLTFAAKRSEKASIGYSCGKWID